MNSNNAGSNLRYTLTEKMQSGLNYYAEGGTRTHTPLQEADFKSAASTIPPPRLVKIGGERI
jgi:hypothetical protein